MTTLFFFDDLRLNRFDNVTRGIGRPQRLEASVYRDPLYETHWAYPSVFRDEASGMWRMVYQGFSPDPAHRQRLPLLAESDDGLYWRPADTTKDIDLPGRLAPNQLLPLDAFGEWPACYVDPHAAPEERIKGLVVYHPAEAHEARTRLWVSPDGLHWALREGVEWQRPGPDPGVGVFWNDVRRTYTFTTRPDRTDRRIALFETRDWQSFTEPELALQADALDAPLTEPYGMPVIPYEGYFVGLLWLFHCVPQVIGSSPHKYLDGHVDCQLAYSLNGWHWQRTLRQPFIANGAPGAPDSGCVYPSSWVVRDNGDLDIYASACTHEHGHIPKGSGSILAYRLRRDGFVYLASAGGVGVVGTRALYWRGGEVQVNVQSPAGAVRVQVTDSGGRPLLGMRFEDCPPFSGDDRAWTPRWREGRRMAELSNRTLRVEVELNNARLYAIRGDFVPLVANACTRFEKTGQAPQPRPGF